MRIFYFIVIFFSSLLFSDIGVFELFNFGTSVYPVDLFFIYFIICIFLVGIRTKFQFNDVNKFFLGFLLISFLSICYGITKYGFSAIGEGRYVYWLLFFGVPIYFYERGHLNSFRDLDKFFKLSYLLIIINILVLLVIEVWYGGRFFLAPGNQEFAKLEDTRGLRYLGSEETFHLGVGLVFLIIDQFISKKKDKVKIIATLFLTAIILFTKNRTSLVSLFLALAIVFSLEGKVKVILRMLIPLSLTLVISFLIFPSLTKSVLMPILSIFDITQDETGSWRLLVQAVAIEQGLQTPIFGQGFGGYFEYYVEVLDQTINYPPHSIYVYLFQKMGIVGLLIYLSAIFSLIRESTAIKKHTYLNTTSEKYRILIKVLLVAQILYGFAYNFSVYFGFYVGIMVVIKKIIKNNKPQIHHDELS